MGGPVGLIEHHRHIHAAGAELYSINSVDLQSIGPKGPTRVAGGVSPRSPLTNPRAPEGPPKMGNVRIGGPSGRADIRFQTPGRLRARLPKLDPSGQLDCK